MPLYLVDSHSPAARGRMRQQPLLFLTPFQRAELTNAIFQHVFRRWISDSEARKAYANFERDCTNRIWQIVRQPERTFDHCISIAQRQVPILGVRTLDTMHVAAALELKADSFWTFDDRQRQLAEAEGLSTT